MNKKSFNMIVYKVICPTCQEEYVLESKIINKSVCCSNCENTFLTPDTVLHNWSGKKDWHGTNIPTRVWAIVCLVLIVMNLSKPFFLKTIRGLNNFVLEQKKYYRLGNHVHQHKNDGNEF